MQAAAFDVHGVVVEVRSNRPELLELVRRRLSFFAAPSMPASARLELLATETHAVSPPAGPARTVYEPETGEVVYDPDADELYIEYGRARASCRAGEGDALVSALEPIAAGAWAVTRPLVTLPLLEVLKRRGIYGVHASGVAIGGQAIVVAGGSGAGKTTLSLALVRAGFDFLGDDMLFLSERAGRLDVLAFPDELDVSATTVSFFPELEGRLRPDLLPGSSKRQLSPEGAGGRVVARSRASLLLFPHISAAEKSELEPLSRDQALLELAPNVLLTDPASSQRHLDALRRLVQESNCFRLSVAQDFGEVVSLVRGLLG